MQKIEHNAAAILMEHTERQRIGKDDLLDEREFTFAESFHTSKVRLFNQLFLDKLPDQYKNLPVPRNARNSRCLVRVTNEQGLSNVSVFDMTDQHNEILIDLERDGTYLIPFSSIQDHLENGDLDLL